jgi:hypothetical protein
MGFEGWKRKNKGRKKIEEDADETPSNGRIKEMDQTLQEGNMRV